ncbi:MAG: (2Fe-2S)-binding protein, partial [Oscillospiraceae bacterium]|nr:(2Fe-2S)-binding protein [Oscillospiraceae bacterium]
MNENKLACTCHNVTYAKVREAVANGARTVDDVARITGAGTACGKCKEFLA